MGIELFFVKNRILSFVAGVAPSNLDVLSSESQSGSNSLIAEGSMTFPDKTCAPISPAFSRSRTLNSSFPVSLAICLSLIAALSPAGPSGYKSHFCYQCRRRTSTNDADIDLVALPIYFLRTEGALCA